MEACCLQCNLKFASGACCDAVCACVQVRLLYEGKERGRMYACYALSSILSTKSGMTEIRAAGVIPALIAVLSTSKVMTVRADLKQNICIVQFYTVGRFCVHSALNILAFWQDF